MLDALKRNLRITAVFMAVRFAVTVLVCFLYLVIAAWIQWAFVSLMGESTFNYIAGGVVSLVVGVAFCYYAGALVLMFVKGWHVSALAYAKKIEYSGAFPLGVGMRAFRRNLISFGAVYGTRMLLKSVLSGFQDKLWTLSEDIPYGNKLKNIAQNPIVEHLANDILHYGFDAAIFYLVREKPEDLGDVPATVLEAVKRYLYCLPSSMLSSISTFVLFRVIPKVLKTLLILYIFLTQGFIAGIFITVLMFPLFYILDNAVFDPLTMTVFLSAYAAKCDEDPDKDSVIYKAVNAVLENEGLSGESVDSVDGDSGVNHEQDEASDDDIILGDVVEENSPVDGGAGIITPPGVSFSSPVEAFSADRDMMDAALRSLSAQFAQAASGTEDESIILPDAEDAEDTVDVDMDVEDLDGVDVDELEDAGGFASFVGSTTLTPEAMANRFKDLNSLFSGKNLSFDPMSDPVLEHGDVGDSGDSDDGHDRASSILAGDDD